MSVQPTFSKAIRRVKIRAIGASWLCINLLSRLLPYLQQDRQEEGQSREKDPGQPGEGVLGRPSTSGEWRKRTRKEIDSDDGAA